MTPEASLTILAHFITLLGLGHPLLKATSLHVSGCKVVAGGITTQPKQGRRVVQMSILSILSLYVICTFLAHSITLLSLGHTLHKATSLSCFQKLSSGWWHNY
jgi:hypothetical protein